MPGLKKNLNLLVNYDPGNGVIQRERSNSCRRFACATYKSDFSWQPSFFR